MDLSSRIIPLTVLEAEEVLQATSQAQVCWMVVSTVAVAGAVPLSGKYLVAEVVAAVP
jgi:hypothetical protein